MGIFDTLAGALGQAMQQGGRPDAARAGQLSSASSSTSNPFSDILSAAGFGSIGDIVNKLSTGGLDQQVRSWLGTGENLPVEGEQIRVALGEDQVKKISQQTGIESDRIVDVLAQYLPTTVDQASPNGKLQEPVQQRSASGQQSQMGQSDYGHQASPAAANPASISDILNSAGFGNLGGIVEKLSNGGLDKQVRSWLGSGENMPVDGEQLRGALGKEPIQKIGQQTGIPADRLAQILAQYLPSAIDQASPNGKIDDRYRTGR